MGLRKIKKMVKGHPAVDGAGVRLNRVLGPGTVEDFDPFLMLDSFDSRDPDDYILGFPMHPHRGIETITYLIEGRIDHEDSLGNKGTIHSGESQWMTAGSGILHQEMPRPSPRLLGLQLWLNLPRKDKMTRPAYLDIGRESIPAVEDGPATVRVISGTYGTIRGTTPRYIPATLYDIDLAPGGEITLGANPEETVCIFLVAGSAESAGTKVGEKTAVLFGEGEAIRIHASGGDSCRFMFFSGKPLGEPVAWGGPIVMNTREELEEAFTDLERGIFIRERAVR